MKSGFIFLLVGLVLGFSFGSFYSSRLSTSSKVACEGNEEGSCAELAKLKGQLEGVTPDEIREYLKIQTAEEKLKKADEILGKIVSALVASIGYKLQKEEVAQLGKLEIQRAPEPAAPAAPPPAALGAPTTKLADSIPLDQKALNVIRIIDAEDDARKFLKSLGSNYSERIQSSGVLNRQQIRELRGRFEGTVLFYKKDRPPYRVSFRFRGRLGGENNSVLEGESELEIYNFKNERISQSRSSGTLTKRITSLGPSVYLQAGSNYFELVFFPRLNEWLGTFMEDDKGKLVPVGEATLKQVGPY